jgi:hypothetical protein
MFFQGRGTCYMSELDANLSPGVYNINLCTDSFAVSLATDTGTHINKCGAVDVEDDRFTKSVSGSIDITFADVAEKNFALATLGWITAQGSPGTVVAEDLPGAAIEVGDIWFLGGLKRHRNITGLTLGSLVANTDYTLDAGSGRVTFLTPQGGSPVLQAAYGYTDPESVSMLSVPVKSYAFMYEDINKRNSNKKGSVELFRVIFDPASNMDFQSDELQILALKGSVLANTSLDGSDLEFGQFGRRIL